MNKEHFFIELKLYLNQLSSEEQQTVINTYEQIFDEKKALGMSEYEVTQVLPSPKQIAQTIFSELGLSFNTQTKIIDDWVEITNGTSDPHHTYNKYTHNDSTLSRPLQLIGIGLLNLFFMFWVILIISILLMSGWLVIGGFIISPLFSLFLLGTAVSTYAWFQFFISLILFGIGLLGFIILKPITKGALKLFMMYHRWCWSVLKGGSNR
ncbi:DUF1700 domain-containing protein [Vagococcus sp. JNUCC 83]